MTQDCLGAGAAPDHYPHPNPHLCANRRHPERGLSAEKQHRPACCLCKQRDAGQRAALMIVLFLFLTKQTLYSFGEGRYSIITDNTASDLTRVRACVHMSSRAEPEGVTRRDSRCSLNVCEYIGNVCQTRRGSSQPARLCTHLQVLHPVIHASLPCHMYFLYTLARAHTHSLSLSLSFSLSLSLSLSHTHTHTGSATSSLSTGR